MVSVGRPLCQSHSFHSSRLVDQILAAIIQNHPFDTRSHILDSTSSVYHNHQCPRWTAESVTQVLRSIPRLLFLSPRSIGRQSTTRHRSALRQRNLKHELEQFCTNALVFGPAAHKKDPREVHFLLHKALEFYNWVETRSNFCHNEQTVKEMALVLVKANELKPLWEFLKSVSRKGERNLVNTATITCLIKALGEEGLADEALATFYRMKQFRCKPDVCAYNTVISALCRVGNFKKARFLLEQMELPGFWCPPDTFTYTILIGAYCRHSMQTGCRKAIRRRLWEANHLFRLMLFKGFVPDVVTYNCLINGCCKTYRIGRALELFEDMVKRGCLPNKVSYNSFIRYYSAVNEIDKAIEMLRSMVEMKHGVPCTSSYTPIIHALCEGGRVEDALKFLLELVDRGSVPREYTYKFVCDALSSKGEMKLLDENLSRRIEEGIQGRISQVMKVKPISSWKAV